MTAVLPGRGHLPVHCGDRYCLLASLFLLPLRLPPPQWEALLLRRGTWCSSPLAFCL